MPRKLDFKAIEEDTKIQEDLSEQRSWRNKRREENPVVQMTVRLPEDVWERFKALCIKNRRTNGDMFRVVLESYLTSGNGEETEER